MNDDLNTVSGKQVREVCDLRNINEMSCRGCMYVGHIKCPKEQEQKKKVRDD